MGPASPPEHAVSDIPVMLRVRVYPLVGGNGEGKLVPTRLGAARFPGRQFAVAAVSPQPLFSWGRLWFHSPPDLWVFMNVVLHPPVCLRSAVSVLIKPVWPTRPGLCGSAVTDGLYMQFMDIFQFRCICV